MIHLVFDLVAAALAFQALRDPFTGWAKGRSQHVPLSVVRRATAQQG